ncbi:WD40-repeat-containing domain protein [Lophiotrema nucula]|uniref:Protein transport protein SEC13 n=1 Tax=Lophiotrema nucula TaxID=690887 RepID=A0A6A5ZPF3_9PLEO|nr:WD40-repeat-containing domain protein [Lophiotrema nucula]
MAGGAVQDLLSFETNDTQHDAQLDYYGRRLATCSSDKTIKIFEVEGESHRLIETLKGHEGAVWSIAWAHPKYGNILASSSYDGRVLIWRENPQTSQFQQLTSFSLHTASVNLVAWAPHEAGCLLACASSDGNVSVLEFKENNWTHQVFQACGSGVNSVSWAPSVGPGVLSSQSGNKVGGERRFVTGGSDCQVKIWEWSAETGSWNNVQLLTGHTDWVRDVAWSPTVLSKSYIASASQDKTVRIWTSSDLREWKSTVLSVEAAAWRVSWSLSGNVLAVSSSDNRVSLWKERLSGGWECVKTLED